MAAAKPRAPLGAGLVPPKHNANPAAVGEASMSPEKPQVAAVESAPAPARVIEEPAGEHPVKRETAAQPAQIQQAAAEVLDPESQRTVVTISSAQPAQLHGPSDLQRVVITAPVHARSAGKDNMQLSARITGDRLTRFKEARHKTGLTGQEIMCEALDIWLAHNGF